MLAMENELSQILEKMRNDPESCKVADKIFEDLNTRLTGPQGERLVPTLFSLLQFAATATLHAAPQVKHPSGLSILEAQARGAELIDTMSELLSIGYAQMVEADLAEAYDFPTEPGVQ